MSENLRNFDAEHSYAAAWASWLLTSCPMCRSALECLMDELQARISTNPYDPRWQRFTDSLPGFHEFWSREQFEIERYSGGRP